MVSDRSVAALHVSSLFKLNQQGSHIRHREASDPGRGKMMLACQKAVYLLDKTLCSMDHAHKGKFAAAPDLDADRAFAGMLTDYCSKPPLETNR